MKMETMSKNIVTLISQLAKNNALIELLINNDDSLPLLLDAVNLEAKITDKIRRDIISPRTDDAKILPYPFEVEATVTDGSFIRVYYNNGDFNENEVIAESQLHIDIIVARSLWLMDDGVKPLVRPYEIVSRVISMVGRNSVSPVRVKFSGYQHLYINTKFDAIRLYADYMSVEK